jgi:hypothetical protein
MRNLLYLSFIFIFFSSCEKRVFKSITTSGQPHIQLNDGTVIHTHEVEWQKDQFNKVFIINGVPFYKNEVAFYSNGKNTFANVHNKFAKMISEGNVNVYKTQRTHMGKGTKKNGYSGGPYRTSNSIIFDRYYIQNMQHLDTRSVVKLNYKNLEPMIPGKAVAYKYLKQYKHGRNATTVTAIIGLGLFAGGDIILNNKKIKGHEGIGWGMMGAGTGMTVISLSLKIPHSYKLYQVVSAYNSH